MEEKERKAEFKTFSKETVTNHLDLKKKVDANEIMLLDTEDLTRECSSTIKKIKKEVEERQKTTMEHIEQILR